MTPARGAKVVLRRSHLDRLMAALGADGRQVIGPTARDGAVVYAPLDGPAQLPLGLADEQEGGQYRLRESGDGRLFGYTVAPQGWKRHLFPPQQRLWAAERAGGGFRILPEEQQSPRYAFLGVRACEIAAMRVQDRVFDNGEFRDPGYFARRDAALIVAVACTRSGGTCFCASMGTGPRPQGGFDLLLTELTEGEHRFVVEIGSERGAAVIAEVPHEPASAADQELTEALPAEAARSQARRMDPEAPRLLREHREHARWDEVAKRCLTCGNCTLVCPTCFCSTTEDRTDLSGERAERWRRWDSCYAIEFSYIHGGAVRTSGPARYRQWISHKLSTWHDQFGTSGCVGCGRCITWCPVGIDITEEVAAIRASEQGS